tara:strand:+ start:8484 stop:9107 length:624 start_codon:yes stop_codon:yes gene_type:complete
MKISYAITVCNELNEIQRLIGFLLENKHQEDEIVILFDSTNGSPKVEEFLRAKSTNGEFNWFPYPFKGHFSDMKNFLTGMCSGDYIYQIDADELPTKFILNNISSILKMNEQIDVLLVPRINTVEGLTQEHIHKWGWRVNNKGWVNFPDYQWRIYRNNDKIKWKNKVHEILEGYEVMSQLPPENEYCLLHDKTIEKQEKQNDFYNKL